MCYLGIVRNGKIELPPGTELPEGATVRVELSDEPDPLDRLEEFAVDGLPPDWASRHDWYIYGVPDSGEE
jgi:hypothetical protein